MLSGLRSGLLVAGAAGLAAMSPALAQAPPPPSSQQAPAAPAARGKPQRTALTFCNKTGSTIDIAVAYVHADTNRWMLSAWHRRQPGECKSFATVKSGLFYYHARSDRGAVWPNDAGTERRWCVPSTAITRDMSSQCGAGETNRPFRGRVTEPGTYTFSFS
jgi:uncharacterized membrane protein